MLLNCSYLANFARLVNKCASASAVSDFAWELRVKSFKNLDAHARSFLNAKTMVDKLKLRATPFTSN